MGNGDGGGDSPENGDSLQRKVCTVNRELSGTQPLKVGEETESTKKPER